MPHAPSAVLRWAVNISIWEPDAEEWDFLSQLIPGEERADVERFKLAKDKQRALVSRRDPWIPSISIDAFRLHAKSEYC